MGRLNLSALRVRQQAIAQKSAEKIRKRPCWLDVVSEVPPATILTRNQTQEHPIVRQRVKMSKGEKHVVVKESRGPRSSSIFKPKEIRYEEDELREQFFRDHPWELARPRVVLENEGNDHERFYYGQLQQRTKRLDGEDVVQRQLYLLNNVPYMTRSAAYDIARREFYKLRLQEDVERRVAQEEARATGAYFGMDASTVGMQLEDKVYDEWLVWAEKENQLQNQKAAAFAGITSPAAEDEKEPSSGELQEPEVTPELEAEILEAQKPTKRPQSVFI